MPGFLLSMVKAMPVANVAEIVDDLLAMAEDGTRARFGLQPGPTAPETPAPDAQIEQDENSPSRAHKPAVGPTYVAKIWWSQGHCREWQADAARGGARHGQEASSILSATGNGI